MFMTSYLYREPVRDPNISDADHLKYENLCKKIQIENFDQVVGFPMERLIYVCVPHLYDVSDMEIRSLSIRRIISNF